MKDLIKRGAADVSRLWPVVLADVFWSYLEFAYLFIISLRQYDLLVLFLYQGYSSSNLQLKYFHLIPVHEFFFNPSFSLQRHQQESNIWHCAWCIQRLEISHFIVSRKANWMGIWGELACKGNKNGNVLSGRTYVSVCSCQLAWSIWSFVNEKSVVKVRRNCLHTSSKFFYGWAPPRLLTRALVQTSAAAHLLYTGTYRLIHAVLSSWHAETSSGWCC